MIHFRLLRLLLIIIVGFSIPACMVVPKKIEYYDYDCHFVAKKYELTTEEYALLENINHCRNDSCITDITSAVFGAALMVPFSAVVSGSIAVVGNTAYWFEKQGNCIPQNKE